MISVGIAGATGYMGGEALRVLLSHPETDIQWLSSRQSGDIAMFHPNLYEIDLKLMPPDQISKVDVAFLALPGAASISMAEELLSMGCKVIDLGAAFRLNDRSQWEEVYSLNHTNWALAEEAVYGISELHYDEIGQCRLVANPGCYSSAAILALAPLVQNHLIDLEHIYINGMSGTAGVGAELSRPAHHPEIGNNLVAYNVIDHRHSYEMEQELSLLAEDKVTVHFTPVYAPITRGILNVCHLRPTKAVTRDSILELFHSYYIEQPFIRIYDIPHATEDQWQYRPYPWVSSISGTNYCHIGLDFDQKRNRLVVFSVLDSLGKGGAQAGVENMNLMFGLDRRCGLNTYGCHP